MKWDEQWVEALAAVFLVGGFMLSILLQNELLSYASVFLSGMVAARIYYVKRYTEPILPLVLIIIGFLVGYLLGNFWSSRITALAFFALGFSFSYYLHYKKIVVIFKSENFIK